MPGTAGENFNFLYQNISNEDKQILLENGINTYSDLIYYINNHGLSRVTKSGGGGAGAGTSSAIPSWQLESQLNDSYPSYFWNKTTCNTTATVSNAIPINIEGAEFPLTDIEYAIQQTGIDSSYGGCGPIAMMGIMDYFSRYLGYKEIINDPTNTYDRQQLAIDVLNEVSTFEFDFEGDKNTMTFPWDYSNGFNHLMQRYNLSNILSANDVWHLFAGHKDEFWNIVVENVDKGLPVTMMSGINSDGGEFAGHYTNIYGYEIWTGYEETSNSFLEKKFLKGRLNWDNCDYEYYCDADILNDATMGIISYSINYNNCYTIRALDFAEEFVNAYGGGQYFFHSIAEPVVAQNERIISTNRLRCSFIENEYLVLSPKRSGAGRAYLDISLPHSASKITFDASLWSYNEDHSSENFKIQYFENNNWVDHLEYDLTKFSKSKNNLKTYNVLLPKNVTEFRFLAEHQNPEGNNNKGRIVLDNLKFEYN